MNLQIRKLTPQDLPQLGALQKKYALAYPGALVIPGEVYLSPSFEAGDNVFCAQDAAGNLVGFAPLYPNLVEQGQHILWISLMVDPDLPAPDPLRDQLLDCLVDRARQIVAGAADLPAEMVFQYFTSETAAITYVQARGFVYEAGVFRMGRDLSQPIPQPGVLDGISIRPWRMESQAEQETYIAARNHCFPDNPMTLADWQYFLQSPAWAVGTCLAAFAGEELVGSLLAYWEPSEDQPNEQAIGFTEYIFVLPEWRGRGIATALVLQGLAYLHQHGLQQAGLEVKATNATALKLYYGCGYELWSESWLLQRRLNGYGQDGPR